MFNCTRWKMFNMPQQSFMQTRKLNKLKQMQSLAFGYCIWWNAVRLRVRARAVHSTYTFSQFVALDSRWFLHRSEACSLHKNWERESKKKRSYHMNHLFLFCSVVSPLLVIKWWSEIRRWLTNGALSVCARYYIVLSMGVNGFFSNKIANQMNSIGWAVCKNAETINGIVNRRHNRSNYLIRISVVLVLAIPRHAFAMIIISSITMRKEERRKKHMETNQLI